MKCYNLQVQYINQLPCFLNVMQFDDNYTNDTVHLQTAEDMSSLD